MDTDGTASQELLRVFYFKESLRERSVRILRCLIRSEEATSAVEYAVVLSLVVVACIVAIVALGETAYDAMWEVADALD